MTAPTPNVGTAPDGSAIFGRANGTVPVAQSDPTSIWYGAYMNKYPDLNVPGFKLWYNTSTSSAKESLPIEGSVFNDQVPGGVNPNAGSKSITATTTKENLQSPIAILRQINAMSANNPQGFKDIQTLLSSDAWGTVKVTGVFDKDTEKALVEAMSRYQQLSHGTGAGMSFTDYLQQFGSQALAQKEGIGNGLMHFVKLDDPNMIAMAAQGAAQSALGQILSPEQVQKFVQEFQSQQAAYQTGGQDRYGRLTSAGIAPDLQSEALAYAVQQNPDQFHSNMRQNYLDDLANFLGGSGTRPSVSESNLVPPTDLSVGSGK